MASKATPIIVAVIMAMVILGGGGFYLAVFVMAGLPAPFLWLTGIVTLAALGALTAVLVQRLRELKGGYEDDLGKY